MADQQDRFRPTLFVARPNPSEQLHKRLGLSRTLRAPDEGQAGMIFEVRQVWCTQPDEFGLRRKEPIEPDLLFLGRPLGREALLEQALESVEIVGIPDIIRPDRDLARGAVNPEAASQGLHDERARAR